MAYGTGELMRIRSWLVVAAALVAAMAGNWAAAGSASAVTRTGASGGFALSPATQRHLRGLFARKLGMPVADIASIARGAVLGPRASNGRD
jgi:hypothetical protein